LWLIFRFVERYAHRRQAAVLVLSVQFDCMRELRDARPTPRGPKVHEHDFAAKLCNCGLKLFSIRDSELYGGRVGFWY
jgi:hypothetical protein